MVVQPPSVMGRSTPTVSDIAWAAGVMAAVM